MKPIVVDGRVLTADDIMSLIQHIDMLKAAAECAQDAYMHQVLSNTSAVLMHVRTERVN